SQQGKLMKVESRGGTPQGIFNAGKTIESASWSREGTILFSHVQSEGIWRISAEGRIPSQVTKMDRSRPEVSHSWPCWLPDGRHFLYTVKSGLPEDRGIYVGLLESKDAKRLVDVDSNVFYALLGFLLYQRDRRLMAHPFDAKRLSLAGDPV